MKIIRMVFKDLSMFLRPFGAISDKEKGRNVRRIFF